MGAPIPSWQRVHEASVGRCKRQGLTSSAFFPQQQPGSSPSPAPGGPAQPCAELDQPLQDCSTDRGNRITQMTQEMAQEVLLMAQSLRRRGRLLVLGLRGLRWWEDWAPQGNGCPAAAGSSQDSRATLRCSALSTLHALVSVWCITNVTSFLPSPPLLGSITTVLSYSTREDNLSERAI